VFLGTNVFAQATTKNIYKEKNGLIEATLFHDNGEIAQTGFYTKEGKLHGEWISFDADGNKTAIAQYNKGQRVGTWMFYQGDTLKEVTYSNNAIAQVNTWTMQDTRVVTTN
jgi:antitoxin component YwqK of YwqJK toxin-antitoxin module